MNKNQVNKIIAREGLILLECILGGVAIIGLNKLSYHIVYLITKPRIYDDILVSEPFGTIKKIGLLVAIFSYPFFLFIRFVIWVIKTLKQKETSREADIKKYIIAGIIILVILGTIVTIGLFNIKRYYEKQKQELSNFKLDLEIDRIYAEQQRQNEERRQREALAAQEEYHRKIETIQTLMDFQNSQREADIYQDFSNNMRDIQRRYQEQRQQKRCYTSCSPSVYHGDGTTSGANCVTQCY